MQFIIAAACIFVGYTLGSIFTLPVLIGITVVCIIVVAYMFATQEELEIFVALAVAIVAIIVNIAMWVGYYMTTNQTWLGDFAHAHILR